MSEEANQLYHYTSMNALFHILNGIKDDNLTLRATHYQYLNDKSECRMLANYYSEYESSIKEKKPNLTDAYITSFSKNEDNLTMYRHYGNAKGVSLCFDVKSFSVEHKFKLCDCDYIKSGKEYINAFYKKKTLELSKALHQFNIVEMNNLIENTSRLHYLKKDDFDSTAHSERLSAIKITKEISDLVFRYTNWINLQTYSFKHDSFKPENEKRLISLKDESTEVKFFEKNGLIKPYIDIQIPVKALKQIWLAPGCDEELSRKSILMLLKSKDVTYITENDIIHSKHPYIDR